MATSTNKYLFVGGPMDGYRRALPGQSYSTRVAVRNTNNAQACPADDLAQGFGISTHTYTMKRCGQHTIMVHSSIPDSEIMNRLIKGYHGHRNVRYRHR